MSACADIYSALTSQRSYRSAHSPATALTIMTSMQKDGPHFDPEIWEQFQDLIYPYPVGQTVVLDDGSEGVVSEVPENNKTEPIVRILSRDGERLKVPVEVQANQEGTPSIVETSPSTL